MHAIESIGPALGIVAFVGLAILAFLLFQQAREIRRLREWAGRAPESATEAADAVQAAAEASRNGEAEEEAGAPSGGRLRTAWDRVAFAVRDRYGGRGDERLRPCRRRRGREGCPSQEASGCRRHQRHVGFRARRLGGAQ